MWETLFPGGSGRSVRGYGAASLALELLASSPTMCREGARAPAERQAIASGRSLRPTVRIVSASISECAAASSSVLFEQLQLLVLACFHPVIQ